MNDFLNKIEIKQISKEVKDNFLQLLKDNNIEVLKKTFIPIYKTQFNGKIYLNSLSDIMNAKKLLISAKEREQENFKLWQETERAKLIQQK